MKKERKKEEKKERNKESRKEARQLEISNERKESTAERKKGKE